MFKYLALIIFNSVLVFLVLKLILFLFFAKCFV